MPSARTLLVLRKKGKSHLLIPFKKAIKKLIPTILFIKLMKTTVKLTVLLMCYFYILVATHYPGISALVMNIQVPLQGHSSVS